MTVRFGSVGLEVGVTAIIPAAGSGRRMGGGTPKQFLDLEGRPVLVHTLQLFAAESRIDEIVIAAAPDLVEATWELVHRYQIAKVSRVVPGGSERQDSVWQALQQVVSRPRIVAVHDAARPLLPPGQLAGILDAAARHSALVMAVPVKDTIKLAASAPALEPETLPRVQETLPRNRLWAAQTPQVFWAPLLERAHRRALAVGFTGTDDAALVERLGHPVTLYPGSPENLKLTTPEDLLLAGALLARRKVE